MLPCPDCERRISTSAKSCPHCGCTDLVEAWKADFELRKEERKRRDDWERAHPEIPPSADELKRNFLSSLISSLIGCVLLAGGIILINLMMRACR